MMKNKVILVCDLCDVEFENHHGREFPEEAMCRDCEEQTVEDHRAEVSDLRHRYHRMDPLYSVLTSELARLDVVRRLIP